MDQKQVSKIVFVVLLVAAAFVLGWFAGLGNRTPQIEVSVAEAPQNVTQAKAPQAHTSAGQTEQTELPEGPLDLNTAAQSDLETLPGIGPELAARIIAYREEIGSFVSKEQIMDVEGIGEKRYAALEQLITVGGTQ